MSQEKAVSQETISSLVNQLKSQEWRIRQEAIQGLKPNRSMGKEVVCALVEALADADEKVRFQLGSILGVIALQDNDVIPILVQALKHPQAEVREYAAFAFTYFGNQPSGRAAVPVIVDLLDDRYARVRGRAVQALEKIDPTNARIVLLFTAALKDPDPKVRQFAAGALGSSGSETSEVIGALTLASRDEIPEVRMVAADVLGRMTASAKDLAPIAVEAQFNYTTNNGTVTVTGYIGSGGAVTIPDSINRLPVTQIGNDVFTRVYSLTSVTIPSSVTRIQQAAFYGCTNLTSVTISKNVTHLGDRAFATCTSLRRVLFQGNAPVPSAVGTDVFLAADQATVFHSPESVGWGTQFGGRPTVSNSTAPAPAK